MDNKSLSHVRWKCRHHIVFIPKYRKKVLYGILRNDVREIISTLCRYKDVEITGGAVCEEVLEHIEDPLKMLKKINFLLSKGGIAFITTVINAPAVDYIYLFSTV